MSVNKGGFTLDLANKRRRLIEENAIQNGLGCIAKAITFDVKTIESLRREKEPYEGKVFNPDKQRRLRAALYSHVLGL
jgi:type I restriction enzyme, R subunit